MRRFAFKWLINWSWYVVFQDHGDGTCEVEVYDRTRDPLGMARRLGVVPEEGGVEESRDGTRVVVAVQAGRDRLVVKNPAHVFSYANKGEED